MVVQDISVKVGAKIRTVSRSHSSNWLLFSIRKVSNLWIVDQARFADLKPPVSTSRRLSHRCRQLELKPLWLEFKKSGRRRHKSHECAGKWNDV